MPINIKTVKIELDDVLKERLLAKLSHLYKFTKGYDSEPVIRVEIGRETGRHLHGQIFKGEIHLSLGKHDFYATELAETLNGAVDLVKDEMIRQLRSFNKRQNTLFRRASRLIKKLFR